VTVGTTMNDFIRVRCMFLGRTVATSYTVKPTWIKNMKTIVTQ
jgi:hypothetical protein